MKETFFRADRWASASLRRGRGVLGSTALLLASLGSAWASTVAISTDLEGGNGTVNQPITVTVALTGSRISGTVNLPGVSGLTPNGTGTQYDDQTEDFNFFVTPTRAGDFTIPAFDIKTQAGETLHVPALKIHVTSG